MAVVIALWLLVAFVAVHGVIRTARGRADRVDAHHVGLQALATAAARARRSRRPSPR